MGNYKKKGYRNQQRYCIDCGEKCLGNGRTLYCYECKDKRMSKANDKYYRKRKQATPLG